MKKSKMVVTLALLASVGLVGCQKNDTAKINELQKSIEEKDKKIAELNDKLKEAGAEDEKAEDAEKPGESGFEEIKIGEEKIVGPFQVATVYFQGVDMIPEGRQPSAAESDMHLEADIHLTKEAGKKYGFGSGKDIWRATSKPLISLCRTTDGTADFSSACEIEKSASPCLLYATCK